ncbi:branched-chain amino acid ABC transporter permease [Dethiobacter alkaliphilus]|uniref:Inner-membrane translocator n=1 Tax=Dethiobacter alkaliphilus AHT 1 TaxID=555088 RepID=C0GDC3_DETAL|nr:branched-chain amino acid ABC transporter permease [Dethiobacter alkaliphilus]EEG78644.1 inner-membrane translocator [Dethiobacter alkaliphilus AHT 1]
MQLIAYLFRKLGRDFHGEIVSLPTRTILLISFLILLVLPLLNDSSYLLRVITLTSIFTIYAASWDLLGGFTGQISFGHALFFGVAAYTSALLNLHLGMPVLITIPLGALAAVLSGLVLGLPGLRLKGPYFSLASLAFPIIMMGIVFTFPQLTGGELGISGITRLAETRLAEYYLSLIIMLIIVLAMWKIVTSKIGLIFHAIREDEITVRASGINTSLYKMLAFIISGLFAGVAGGMYAHFMRVVGPSTLELIMSLQIIVWVIFGGIATIYGSAVGVFILFPLMEYLRVVPEYRMLIFALIVILVLRIMPEGISNWAQDLLENECPRCKERNAFTRSSCRICGTEIDSRLQINFLKRGA